jgi:hypothetical protein
VDLKRVSAHEGDDELSVSLSCRPFWRVCQRCNSPTLAGIGKGIGKRDCVERRTSTNHEE